MMGGSTMMGNGSGMMGGDSMMGGDAIGNMMTVDMIAEMPVDRVFTMISQTCSACHTKFRAEGN